MRTDPPPKSAVEAFPDAPFVDGGDDHALILKADVTVSPRMTIGLNADRAGDHLGDRNR
ncbi:MAG: hypothetical protein HOI95_13030 [Chromatiales bacterium]|nr:hypothetical protein [Chromatiales bacterium]